MIIVYCDFIKKVNLRNRQRYINRKYAKEGLTDEILDLQVQLNKERNELDIMDPTEEIVDGFVQ